MCAIVRRFTKHRPLSLRVFLDDIRAPRPELIARCSGAGCLVCRVSEASTRSCARVRAQEPMGSATHCTATRSAGARKRLHYTSRRIYFLSISGRAAWPVTRPPASSYTCSPTFSSPPDDSRPAVCFCLQHPASQHFQRVVSSSRRGSLLPRFSATAARTGFPRRLTTVSIKQTFSRTAAHAPSPHLL